MPFDCGEYGPGFGLFDQDGTRADQHLGHCERMELAGMIERQRKQCVVALDVLAAMDAAHVLGKQRAVRHQPAFWKAGGARGVDNLAVICTAHFPLAARVTDSVQCGVEHIEIAATFELSDEMDLGQVADAVDMTGERFVDDKGPCAGLLQDVAKLAPGQTVVRRYMDQPGLRASQPEKKVGV